MRADIFMPKGNPPLLLLDEPTSSIDASSKRSLWKILLQLNNQAPSPSSTSSPPRRSLLLTTHSMEEASHLASRAAILSKRILALGSIKDLRMRWGDVYHVHIVLKSAPDSGKEEMERVEMWVKERFDGAKADRWGSIGGQIRFSVPAGLRSGENTEGRGEGFDEISPVGGERKGSVGELFRTLESSKEGLGLAFYSVRATSMDEVFLNVVRENNVREEEGRGK
jgi:ATP-binding cassette subfamily A (ABC1) protein 3